MVGSDPTLVAVVVPIVALISLAFWLGMCFYAGSHPFWRHQQQTRQQQLAGSQQPGTLPPSARPGLSGAAAGAATAASPATAAGPERVTDS
jgi:hypothetical protein